MKRIIAAVLAVGTVAVAVVPAGATASSTSSKNIVQIAASNPSFTTLVKLIKSAGLVKALSGTTKLTVFAPTNAAFAKVPASTLAALGKNKAELTKVLEYHVVAGSHLSTSLMSGEKLTTLEGSTVAVKITGGHVYINNAEVTQANIPASNGVIHVINAVLIPKNL